MRVRYGTEHKWKSMIGLCDQPFVLSYLGAGYTIEATPSGGFRGGWDGDDVVTDKVTKIQLEANHYYFCLFKGTMLKPYIGVNNAPRFIYEDKSRRTGENNQRDSYSTSEITCSIVKSLVTAKASVNICNYNGYWTAGDIIQSAFVIDVTDEYVDGMTAVQFYEMCKNCTSSLASGRDVTINERAGKVMLGPTTESYGVPREYRRVSRLVASGGQYIDTEIVPDASTSIEMLIRTSDPLFRCGIAGRGYFHADGGAYKFDGTTGTHDSGIYFSQWKSWVLCAIDYSDNKIRINDYVRTANIDLTGNELSFYIMNRNGNLVTSGSSGAVYWFKAYRNGELIRDFVPVVRRSDSKPGLYDLVTKRFFTNAGTGDFSAGAYVDLSDDYIEVEYLKATGSQRIVLPTIDYDYIKVVGQYQNTASEQALIGNVDSGSNNRWEVFCDVTRPTYNIWTAGASTTVSTTPATQKATVEYDANDGYAWKVDGVTFANKQLFVQPKYVMAYSPEGTGYHANVKVFSVLISYHGQPTVDLVPVIRRSDRKPGMYDRVTGAFLTNANTGEFITGPDAEKRTENHKAILPPEYQEVEYIESPGGENYFDSGVMFDEDYTGLDLKYLAKEFQFGACNMTDSTMYTLAMYGNGGLYVGRGSASGCFSFPSDGPHILSVRATDNVLRYSIDGVGKSMSYPGVANGAPERAPLIFGRWEVNYTKRYASAGSRLYYCRILTSDTEVARHFVPCYRRADHEVGLYDLVTGTFFENQGPASFITGPDVNRGETRGKLPYQYAELSYIQSTGTQYIDTGVFPSQDLSVSVKVMKTGNPTSWPSILGAVNNSVSAPGFALHGDATNDYINARFNETSPNIIASPTVKYGTAEHEVTVSFGRMTVDGVEYVQDPAPTFPNITSTIYLFARSINNQVFQDAQGSCRLYWTKISNGDTIVRDLVPCYRKYDGVIGMYDVVTGTFFTNRGTGTFIMGPERVWPDEVDEVDYLEGLGSQYIDTGIRALKAPFRMEFEFRRNEDWAQDMCVFGQRNLGKFVNTYSTYYETVFGDTSANTLVSKRDVRMTLNSATGVFQDGDTPLKTGTTMNRSSDYPAFMFAFHENEDGNPKWWFRGRIYFYSIYEGGALTHAFTPALRKADSKPGMYDKVTGSFYVNKGSGEFSYGYRNPFDAYQRVQYIESTGTQYVNTGYAMKATDVVNIELMPLQTNVDLAFFGNYDSGTTGYAVCELGQINNSFRFNVYSNNVPLTVDSKYSFTRKDDGAWYYNGTRQNGAQTEDCYMSALIFGRWWNGGPTKLNKMRLYGLSIRSFGEMVRDFVPCYRKSDGEVGLWDASTSTFYGNAGTGVFLRGPEVNVAKTAPIEPAYGYNQLIPTLSSNYWYGERNAGTANARTFDPSTNSSTYTADSVNKGFRLLSNTGAFTISVVAGHKYLYSAKHSWQLDNAVITKMSYLNVGNTNLLYGMPITNGGYTRAILSCTVSATDTYFATSPIIDSGTVEPGDTFTTKDFMLIDLTEWFGIGKEPTSVGEFTAKFPRAYYGFWKEPISLTRRQINSPTTYAYNQQANPTPSNMNGSGTAWTTDGRNFRFQATNDGGSRCSVKNLKIVANHKYLLSCWLTQSKSGTCLLTMYNGNWTSQCMATTPMLNAGVRTRVAYIGTASFDESNGQYSFYMRYPASTSTGDSLLVENLNVIDLTAMFGEGNEPATVDEFRELFPHAYYPYCAGSKLNRAQINAIAKD